MGTLLCAAEIPLRVAPSPPDRSEAANAEEEMRKNKMAVLALVVMLTTSVSCSRIGKPSDDAITTDIKAKMFSDPALKAATVDEPARRPTKTRASLKNERSRQVAASTPASPVAEASSAAAAPVATPAPPPPPQPVTVTVPANTIVTVRTIDSIDSKTNQAGQVFKASLDAPIVVDNRVIVPSGADAYIKLVDAKSAGHITGRSELGLVLASVVFQGKTYNVTSSDVKQSGTSRGKQSAERVGGGAAIGAL